MPERWEQFQDRLGLLELLKVNFDLEHRHEYSEVNGWRIDRHEADLPSEPPGEPIANGSFEAAKSITGLYQFPPPDLITGIFRPDGPLEGRMMLLEARFLWFRFWFGVRITEVTDGTFETEAGRERQWGYSYATLEGHFERGQITFIVAKHLETGSVSFRIASFSQRGSIRNLLHRFGFWVFGRMLQERFVRESLSRMQRLVKEKLVTGMVQTPSTPVITATTGTSDSVIHEKLENTSGLKR
jgi:Domain of unknown function (DUF1990)